ncbi:MAG: divergent polysaccharide deacetylase family protein [Rhodoplanes sp.]|nr:divergent polysaccharide deacetylase family protein [Rhodoplanes sp.]
MPIAALLVLCLVTFVGWAFVVDDPLGGEPVVVVKLPAALPAAGGPAGGAAPAPAPSGAEAPAAPKVEAAAATPAPAGPAAGGQTITIIDGSTGKRQEVTLPAAGGAAGGEVKLAAVEQSLLEATRHGHVPRIGLNGGRPSVVYARKPPPLSDGATARVALVIGGLGVSATATADAMKKLPGVVTFAFVPYGNEVDKLVAKARGEGHEVLLQLPMEPFEYPDNDPGPQTLLTSLTPEQNIDRMQWAMSRFQGYVGIVNYMGGRFTSTETAIGPVLREVAKRGLVYVDDGSSPRSLAGQFAGANNLPFAKAAVVLDAVPSNAELDRALAKLEAVARESGSAVGIARALPLSIERLAQWAKQAEGRGIVLVPITAIAAKAKAS